MANSEALTRRDEQTLSRPNNTRQVKRLVSLTIWWGFWMTLIVVGVALANWQWQRAEEKTQLLESWAVTAELHNPVVAPDNLANVTLTGHFLAEETLWLDNRILDGQVGVAVLTPFVADTGHWWLIQRGFIPTQVDRRIEPEVSTPSGSALEVSGRWQETQDNLVFGDNREGNRLQSIDLHPWRHLSQPSFDGVIHQAAGDGYLAGWWKPSQMPPERHIAYAVQWLCLALLALVVAVVGHRVLYRKTNGQERI